MSGQGDTRWRRSGQQQQPPRQNQQQQKHDLKQNSSRERSYTPQRQPMSGNAWTNQDKGKGAPGAAQRGGQTQQQQGGVTPPPAGLAEEQHVPLKDFNAADTKAFLKKGYKATVSANGGDEKKLLWKPQDGSGPPKSAWGTRPGAMHDGRNFWNQLREQTNQLEQQNKAGG